MTSRQGFIEQYRSGFVEVVVDEDDLDRDDDLDWWKIKALYLPDGEVFEPGSRLYRTSSQALKVAQTLVDWVINNPREVHLWGCFPPNRQILNRITDRYGCCRLPYYVTVDEGVLTVVCPDSEAIAAGWLEAVELNHIWANLSDDEKLYPEQVLEARQWKNLSTQLGKQST